MIRALGLLVLATAAFAGVVSRSGSYAGNPPPATAPAPGPAPYTAPPAPYTAPEAPKEEPQPPKEEYKPPKEEPQPPKEEYKPPQEEYKAPEAPEEPKEQCWTESRKCCYKEKQDGYVCQDDYTQKQARCHPKIVYERKCEKLEGRPPQPEPKVIEDKCEYVQYDANYGPHVEGYPNGGMSEEYDTKELPNKPYKVEADPHPPTAYQPPANDGYAPGYAPAPQPAGY